MTINIKDSEISDRLIELGRVKEKLEAKILELEEKITELETAEKEIEHDSVMENKIKNLIIKNTIRDIQIAMLRKREAGFVVSENIVNEILFDIESKLEEKTDEAEIDEGGEELDEEKIADAIDTEDLGAKADMEWEREKDERLGL